ncbi:MAG: hypothetical protein AABZ27_01855 [Candidatus Omnitrophota bacterium]|mgnify:CR=1 FL=1
MAEEVKETKETKETEKADSGKAFKTALKVLLGIAFLALGGYLVIRWWWHLIHLAQGSLGLILVLAGVITLAIAKE